MCWVNTNLNHRPATSYAAATQSRLRLAPSSLRLRTSLPCLRLRLLARRTQGNTKAAVAVAARRLVPVRLPPRSPDLNAHLERFFGSLKSECLYKLILFGETATRRAVRSYVTHYHTERNHQGLENDLIVPMVRPPDMDAEIETTERLGGLLRSYRRAA